ncbi:MAG: 50S ribosomal protein L11 methyltransferase [Tissierellia bacterium]|nr:50S ribosomal protein L11 methyltransferase [Tissierellia bacterium]
MKYQEFIIEGKQSDYNEITLLLSNLGIECYQEESAEILSELDREQKDWNYVDESVFDLKDETLRFYFYISEESDSKEMEKLLRKSLKEKEIGTLMIKEVEDQNWANEWKKHYKPFSVGEHLQIIPSWEEYIPTKDDIVITLDPGMAFGSGTHETTYLCMEKLEKYIEPGDVVLDIGCGSGILSIVSGALGAKKVLGIDIDPVAIKASKENAKLNKVDDICTFQLGNLLDGIYQTSNLIVSNIVAEIIITFIEEVYHNLVLGGIFITSGIIVEKKELVMMKLKDEGFKILEDKTDGEWVVIVAEKI